MSDAKRESYFQAAVDWDTSQREQLVNAKDSYKKIAIGASCIAGLCIASIFVLLPLHKFIPITIRVDNVTGSYDVSADGERFKIGDKRNDKIMVGDLTRYIRAREGFTRGEADFNYKTVYLMSCGGVRGEWDNYFRPENNPQSPVNTMTPTDSDKVEIQNVSFLPTDSEELRVAQVRFDRTTTRGATQPVRTRYISTLTYKYDPGNVPEKIGDIQVNAFGFCAINYRRDQEGAPVPVGTTPAIQPAAPVASGGAAVTPANIGVITEVAR